MIEKTKINLMDKIRNVEISKINYNRKIENLREKYR